MPAENVKSKIKKINNLKKAKNILRLVKILNSRNIPKSTK